MNNEAINFIGKSGAVYIVFMQANGVRLKHTLADELKVIPWEDLQAVIEALKCAGGIRRANSNYSEDGK